MMLFAALTKYQGDVSNGEYHSGVIVIRNHWEKVDER